MLISPYGGKLVNLLVGDDERDELKTYAGELDTITLSERSLCDFELIANGGFSPLDRFMSEADHQSVLDDMRLTDGTIFPMPIPLPVDEETAERWRLGRM